VRDLTEAELIEMEHTSRELAQLTADYENDGKRQSWDKAEREDARYDMKAFAAEVSADVESLCEYLRTLARRAA